MTNHDDFNRENTENAIIDLTDRMAQIGLMPLTSDTADELVRLSAKVTKLTEDAA
jgi:hypothetical protein